MLVFNLVSVFFFFFVTGMLSCLSSLRFCLSFFLLFSCRMPVGFVGVLYNREAVLFGTPPTPLHGITHSVLICTATEPHSNLVLEFDCHGVKVNGSTHSYRGQGWYVHEATQDPGVVFDEGFCHPSVTLESFKEKALDGTWKPESYAHNNKSNCYGFVNDMIAWARTVSAIGYHDAQKSKKASVSSLVQPSASIFSLQEPLHLFTSRFQIPKNKNAGSPSEEENELEENEDDDDSSFLGPKTDTRIMQQENLSSFTSRFGHVANAIALLPPIDFTKLEPKDSVADLTTSALIGLPTMHLKEDLIGLLFSKSNLTVKAIHDKIPSVSESTIKRGLKRAAEHKLEIVDKQHTKAGGRDRLFAWERDFFKEAMAPFFTGALSGSKENKKGQVLWRTVYTPIVLWTHYVRTLPKMIATAKLANESSGKMKYVNLDHTPRCFDFFKNKLLKLIYYTEETNARRCHYCEDLEVNEKEEIREMAKNEEDRDANLLADLEKKLAIGRNHKARWYHQTGYVHGLRQKPAPEQVLIQTDYFSFYTVTRKRNCLALVLTYQDRNGEVRKEHVQYYSNHPHDYVYSTVCFNHALSATADILVNARGPKFKDVVIAGDTAMFKGPFLCCLKAVVDAISFDSFRVVPFCAKHGNNDCDGAAARIKKIADQMVINKSWPEHNPAAFCATAMEGAPTLRAYPMYAGISTQKGWVDSLLPGGLITSLRPPRRGFGEFVLKGTPPFCLKARTLVGMPEPWRLGAMGYPLCPGLAAIAETWSLVDMASNPKTQCLPCAALFGRPTLKLHDACAFAEYTKHKRCGKCHARDGHNKRNCPMLLYAAPAVLDDDEEVDDENIVLKLEELESESELSDEMPELEDA